MVTARFTNRIGCVLTVLAGALGLVAGGIFGSDKEYSVVLDAGSSSTKLLVAVFERKSDRLHLRKEELYETFKPGLSDFDDDIEGLRKQLAKILQTAERFVPNGKLEDTPVKFRGTAGFRLLPEEKRGALLLEVENAVGACKFKKTSYAVSIMSESDEGLFGWVAANLLTDRIHGSPDDMVAILDLGGASTQISFPLTHAFFRQFPLQVRWIQIYGERINFYTRSYIGLGMGAATVGVLALDNPQGATTFYNPCVSSSDNGKTYHYNGDDYLVYGTEGDSREDVNIEDCTSLTQTYVKSFTMRNYDPVLNYKVVAIAGFYFALRDAKEIDPVTGGHITIEDIKVTADRICRTPGPHDDPFLCLHLIYIHTLLTEGYKFPSTTELSIMGTVDGHHINWALGLAYYSLENDM